MVVTEIARRPIHSRGAVFDAVFRSASVLPELANTVFDDDRPRSALVRISLAFGASRFDFIGLAVKLVDAYGPGKSQDFVLVSSPCRPVLRRLPVPVTDVYSSAFFCSGTSYAVSGRKIVLGARFRASGVTPWHPLIALLSRPAAGIDLLAAAPHGRWRLVAQIELLRLAPVPDLAVRFDPANGGEGFVAVGKVNRIRSVLYHHFQTAVAHKRRPVAVGVTEIKPGAST